MVSLIHKPNFTHITEYGKAILFEIAFTLMLIHGQVLLKPLYTRISRCYNECLTCDVTCHLSVKIYQSFFFLIATTLIELSYIPKRGTWSFNNFVGFIFYKLHAIIVRSKTRQQFCIIL